MQTITFHIESRLENVALVGEALFALCELIPELDSNQIRVAAIEAINNAVLHAYGNEAGHWIIVTWSLSATRLELTISDQGLPLARPLAENWPDDHDEGGRGGPLMWNCMDHLEWRQAGGTKTLLMYKQRPIAEGR